MLKTYNWGILGKGYIARKMAEALPFVPQSKLLAIASRNESTAKEFAKQYHVEKAYSSYEELAQDTNIDIVYIATPHNLHCENTLMCLDNGKHVLCEKPFAVNGSEVRLMIEKAKNKKLFLMEALWSRFLPHIIKAKEIIDSGQLGKIKLFTADFGINVPFDPNHRIFNKELIGGSLLDLGIYNIFLATYLFGKPKTIIAKAGIGSTGVDNNCSVTFGFEDEKLAVMYSSSVAKTDVVANIYGEKGTLCFDPWWFCPVNLKIKINEIEKPITFNFKGNGYNYEAEEVINCLEKGMVQSNIFSWEDSLQLIDMLDTIRKEINLSYPKHDNKTK